MRKFTRSGTPQVLQENGEQWGKEYAAKRKVNPAYAFRWPQFNKQPLNQIILPELKNQTSHHCSYCDKFPLLKGDESIDHFKPKTDERFYEDVCNWHNLYVACKHCQDSKMTQYNDHLLRPDDITYRFLKYFIYNYNEHKIEPNPAATGEEKMKAEETIRIFNLNHASMKTSRRHAYERFVLLPNADLEDFNFRFIFE